MNISDRPSTSPDSDQLEGKLNIRAKRIPLILGFSLTGAAIAFLLLVVDFGQLGGAVSALARQPELIAIFVIGYSAAFWLRSVAWGQMLPGLGIWKMFAILHASLFANHVLPIKGGEVLRPFLAARSGVSLRDAATTTVLSRLLDIAGLVAIASIFLMINRSTASFSLINILVPSVVVLLVLVGFMQLRFYQGTIPLPNVLAKALVTIREGLRNVPLARVVGALLWTIPSWMLEAVVILVAAHALGIDLSIEAAVGVTAVVILAQIFHFTPGGIGTYEAAMTGALVLQGVPANDALALAVLTHALKFLYSYSFGLAFALPAFKGMPGLRGLGALRGSAEDAKPASRFEIMAARTWNLFNEGKPFTPIFVMGIILLLSVQNILSGEYWLKAGAALLAIVPLFVVFFRYDFPLKLRVGLWVYLALFLLVFGYVDLLAVGLLLGLYFSFTVGLWGSVYYHLRIGTPWTNFTRFWKLVLENPDPTSGNFLEQVPKALLLVLSFRYLVADFSWQAFLDVELLTIGIALSAVLLHQWFFTWVPPLPLSPTRLKNISGGRISRKFIAIVIDGCRADRLLAADTPCIDRLKAEGATFNDMRTVYPARTVTCFSSMLTGAPPRVHGMGSNFVPRLGVKCDSIFASLEREGLKGRLVGIAHLIDAFGEEDVRSVTAVTHNDEIDHALASKGKDALEQEDPDLLVLQLLSVDQTGHARGSYNQEYLEKIECSDSIIQEFLDWCRERGYLEDATVLITADHGQGIGIGGHGHMSPTEIHVPCILWGKGIEAGQSYDYPVSIVDVAPTISYFLGTSPPESSVGQVLIAPDASPLRASDDVAVVIPARNEAANLPGTLSAIPRDVVPNLWVVVVDDGSTDDTSDVAYKWGADLVVRHERNRGLGAALRTGLGTARDAGVRAAVYLDADGEYDAREIPLLLDPIESGRADYVLGSRFKGTRRGQPIHRLLANLAFTGALCVLAGRRITDGQTGFRAFSREALSVAEIIHDYNYAQVLTLDLLHKGMKMTEVPITYTYRGHGRSFISLQYLWRVPLGIAREVLQG